jgi:hypothetical protein
LLPRLFFCPLPIQFGLYGSVYLGQVEELPRRKPLARPANGISQNGLAISKDMHVPSRARHKDIKLSFVRLAERPNGHTGNDLIDSLRLADVIGDGYSLVEMQSGPIANNLPVIEFDLAFIDADHPPELVIEELLPAVFDVFRESDPVADCQRDLLSLKYIELLCLAERQPRLGAVLSDDLPRLISEHIALLGVGQFSR